MALHRHRNGVGLIPVVGLIFDDEFSQTFLAWISTCVRFPLKKTVLYLRQTCIWIRFFKHVFPNAVHEQWAVRWINMRDVLPHGVIAFWNDQNMSWIRNIGRFTKSQTPPPFPRSTYRVEWQEIWRNFATLVSIKTVQQMVVRQHQCILQCQQWRSLDMEENWSGYDNWNNKWNQHRRKRSFQYTAKNTTDLYLPLSILPAYCNLSTSWNNTRKNILRIIMPSCKLKICVIK